MSTKTLITAEEFWQGGPETDGYELVRGELVPMPPPGDQHGLVCANIVFILKTYTRQLGHGVVISNDAGIITEKDPDTVRGVDVTLYLKPAWTEVPAGYSEVAPDLAVEVRSPKQSWGKVVGKTAEYLAMGVAMVWIVDPQARRVTMFTANQEPQTLAAENQLDGGQVLPSFRCQVGEFFEGLPSS